MFELTKIIAFSESGLLGDSLDVFGHVIFKYPFCVSDVKQKRELFSTFTPLSEALWVHCPFIFKDLG